MNRLKSWITSHKAPLGLLALALVLFLDGTGADQLTPEQQAAAGVAGLAGVQLALRKIAHRLLPLLAGWLGDRAARAAGKLIGADVPDAAELEPDDPTDPNAPAA